MRNVGRSLATLLVVAAFFTACAEGGSDAASDEELAKVREAATEAVETAGALEDRVEELEGSLGELTDTGTTVADELGALRKRLKRSLADLRAALRKARGEATDASSSASSALARVAALERDLAVLEDRFNFHLKSKHGGG